MGALFVSLLEGFREEGSAARELQLESSRLHIISITNNEDEIMSYKGIDSRYMLRGHWGRVERKVLYYGVSHHSEISEIRLSVDSWKKVNVSRRARQK